jgi:excisionase family DNA binding protein
VSQIEWLSVEQIASELGLTEDTIRNYIRTRQLAAYRIGNTYRIKREDFDKFLEKRKISDGSDT